MQTPSLLGTKLRLGTLFDEQSHYYAYAGSLTTPGCHQVVTWIVMETPRVITLETLNKFKVPGDSLDRSLGCLRALFSRGNLI